MKYKDFYQHLIIEGHSASDIEYEYDDYLQENPETEPLEDIKIVLDNMKVKYNDINIPFSGNSYILTDQAVIEFDPTAQNYPLTFHKKDRFLYDSDFSEIESNVEETFNKDFWGSPSPLYHGTRDENVDGIKENGLNTTTGTGISNRGTSGVFTVSNIDLILLGEYGDNIFKIDTSAMKRDGVTPYVSMEPDVLDGAVRGQIAHIIGDNRYSPDSSDGQWEETVIINGKIDPKYLTLLQK
jgi:hypothetical protein